MVKIWLQSILKLCHTKIAYLFMVEFDDFARFAELWRHYGIVLAADLDGSGHVDFGDLKFFADLWLRCCPMGWPLK